jgi:hypothetical protein
MTTPSPADRRRPRLLVFLVLAWVAAAALAVGGSFAPLFTETETPSTPSAASSSDSEPSSSSSSASKGSSFEVSAWEQKTVSRGQVVDRSGPGTWFGLPIVVAAAVLFAGGLVGIGALLAGSDPGLRWSTAIAGAGAAILFGAVATVAMVAKALSDEFGQIGTTVGRSDYFDVEAGVGNGLWMMLFGATLGIAAVCVALIARHRIGPNWLRPVEPTPVEVEAPPTPSFGVPVIRPVGYD